MLFLYFVKFSKKSEGREENWKKQSKKSQSHSSQLYIYIRSALTRVLDRLRASPIPRSFLSFHNFMRLRNLIDRYGWFIGAFYYLFLTISLGISLFPVMVINLSQ